MKRIVGLSALLFISLALVTPALAQDGGKTIEQIAAEQEIPIAQQIGNFYTWGVGISALVALGILIYAGLAYTAAGGNASRQQDAKQWIWNALIGLLILFGSYIILNTINPELTKLQNLDLSQVQVATEAPQAAKGLDLAQLIGNFYNWALGIGGLIALGIIIFGGILYTISPGNASRQGDAKIWIGSAVIGLVLLFGSYAILNTVNPDLTRLVSLEEGLKKAEFSAPAGAPQAAQEIDLSGLIGNFYAWALGIGGVLALGVLIFGGILYTTSAGNASRQDEAKTWLLGALIGLLILFGSYAILNTVNPELTKLANLKEMLSGSGGQFASEKGDGPQDQQYIGLSEIINKQLGRKSLESTGLFNNENCGGGEFGACSVKLDDCDELRRNGAICVKDVFIPIFSLISPPQGLFKIPLPTRLLGPIAPWGFSLVSDPSPVPGGNCQTPLNPVLVDDIAALKNRFPKCFSSAQEGCYIQPRATVCTREPRNNDEHPIKAHLELRAVDLTLYRSITGSGDAEEKNREIIRFLGETKCVANLMAPSRFGSLCREGNRATQCTGIKERGREVEIIHYDIKSSCR